MGGAKWKMSPSCSYTVAKDNQDIGWALLHGMNKLLSEGNPITVDGEFQLSAV